MNQSVAPQDADRKDWRPADIKAALENAGWSIARIARHHGVSRQLISYALRHHSWTSEKRIADALDVHPMTIWPSRYDPDGFWSSLPRVNSSTADTVPGDWRPADIKAALDKAGWSICELARHHGVAPCGVSFTLRNPSAPGEQRIADALGIHPMEIWPSRYNPDGSRRCPSHGRPRKNAALHKPEPLA